MDARYVWQPEVLPNLRVQRSSPSLGLVLCKGDVSPSRQQGNHLLRLVPGCRQASSSESAILGNRNELYPQKFPTVSLNEAQAPTCEGDSRTRRKKLIEDRKSLAAQKKEGVKESVERMLRRISSHWVRGTRPSLGPSVTILVTGSLSFTSSRRGTSLP
ncbi:hypothetical protein MPNT_30144 [Candidatus Methylacidithermus pantelleriae]|uniref:Uncharacterized protein n=1 Tax=Candidatus Methylacidithermus pantelleriae TaxID=2744239 RepID=A0A8J2BTL2_9BACT|nr:hypothetical protein MPNT_30144 [Candidatus Methylacidithermus pantelleriae]